MMHQRRAKFNKLQILGDMGRGKNMLQSQREKSNFSN